LSGGEARPGRAVEIAQSGIDRVGKPARLDRGIAPVDPARIAGEAQSVLVIGTGT